MKDRRRLLAVFVASCLLPAAVWAALGWHQATPAAPWAPRALNALVAFKDTMWLMGGITYVPGTIQFNDVWKSADGVGWVQAESAAAWSPRDGHAVVAFHDTMWLTGGEIVDRTKRDVWYSANGTGWTPAVDSAPWSDRGSHTLVKFRDTLWLAGGLRWDGSMYWPLSDVWKSGDCRTWLLVDSSAPWGVRGGHTSVVFKDTMWVIGGADWLGHYYNDVWKSGDGHNWILATDPTPWGRKYMHGSVVTGDTTMWVMGGWSFFPQRTNDVWSSTDGGTWIQDDSSAKWPKRGHVTALAYHDRIWVMAGDTSAVRYTGSNDVWYSNPLGIEETPTAEVRKAGVGPTILSGASSIKRLASCDLFDAMGRRTANPKPGVYFVRKASDMKREASSVIKVVVTK